MKKEYTEGATNKASFFLGVFVTLIILGLVVAANWLFWRQQQQAASLITGENDLNDIVHVDWSTFWRLEPNLSDHQVVEMLADDTGRSSTYSYSTNELGFRSPPIKSPKPPLRILAIGDSTTFGQHLEDAETWPARLQMLLDPVSKEIEVINAGVIGASSFQGLSFLVTQGLALKPDIVIATFGFNDWAQAPLSDRARARLYAERGVLSMFKRATHAAFGTGKEMVPRATPGEYVDHLFFLADICEKNNISLLFLIWPSPWEVEEPVEQMSRYKPYLEEVCRITEAECIDLQPVFAAADVPTHLDCIHGTVEGCGLVAEAIAALVKDKYGKPSP